MTSRFIAAGEIVVGRTGPPHGSEMIAAMPRTFPCFPRFSEKDTPVARRRSEKLNSLL
jgi:hypothetical protein